MLEAKLPAQIESNLPHNHKEHQTMAVFAPQVKVPEVESQIRRGPSGRRCWGHEQLLGLKRACSIKTNLPLRKQTNTSSTALALSQQAIAIPDAMERAFHLEHHFHKAYSAYLKNTWPVIEGTLPECYRCSATQEEKDREFDLLKSSGSSTGSSSRLKQQRTKEPPLPSDFVSLHVLKARQEGMVPALADCFIEDLVKKFGPNIPCADARSPKSKLNRFARIYLGHREVMPGVWNRQEWCETTPIHGDSIDDPLGSFSLTVEKLEAMTADWEWSSIYSYVKAMAHVLAVSHWSIGCDGGNLGFAIGGPPDTGSRQKGILYDDTSAISEKTIVSEDPRIWILPSFPYQNISIDHEGVEVCVKAFMTNKKPYFPRPYMKKVQDQGIWDMFRSTYLQESHRFLSKEGDPLLGLAFIKRVEQEEIKRLEAGILVGEIAVTGNDKNVHPVRRRFDRICKSLRKRCTWTREPSAESHEHLVRPIVQNMHYGSHLLKGKLQIRNP